MITAPLAAAHLHLFQVTFKFRHHFLCNTFNIIRAVICDTCIKKYILERYIGETGKGKPRLRDKA